MQRYPAVNAVLAKDGGLQALLEMCFTPGALFNDRLKEAISQVQEKEKATSKVVFSFSLRKSSITVHKVR